MSQRRGRRRRVVGELADQRVWALLTGTERRALGRLAADERMPISILIREAINSFVADFSDEKPITYTGKSSAMGS